jgi:hypothetical protein
MGIYLGANELGGGSGAGGGGGFLSDPKELNRCFVYSPRCEVKTTESAHGFLYNEYVKVFDDINGGIYATLTAADTYVTTHDITSSTNGGGVLHLLMLGGLHSGVVGDTTTCRITLDGEEHVISTSLLQADSQGYYRPLLGNFVLNGMATTSSGNVTYTNSYNFGNTYRTQWQASTVFFTNGFTSGSSNHTGYTYVPTVASMGQLGGVRFKESLKVEFKADKVSQGSYQSNKVASLVTTF